MGEVISVISGKGGTGKTTVCAAVASCLAAEGSRVLCIDADIGLRNLDIALGMAELPVLAFTEVLEGNFTLMDATAHPELDKLFLLTAPSRAGDRSVSPAAFAMLLHDAREEFDYVLIDSAAGIGDSFRLATDSADRCVIVLSVTARPWIRPLPGVRSSSSLTESYPAPSCGLMRAHPHQIFRYGEPQVSWRGFT